MWAPPASDPTSCWWGSIDIVLRRFAESTPAFIATKVAATIAKGIVNSKVLSNGTGLTLVSAALVGAIIWNQH